jgi:hypothetical protein
MANTHTPSPRAQKDAKNAMAAAFFSMEPMEMVSEMVKAIMAVDFPQADFDPIKGEAPSVEAVADCTRWSMNTVRRFCEGFAC